LRSGELNTVAAGALNSASGCAAAGSGDSQPGIAAGAIQNDAVGWVCVVTSYRNVFKRQTIRTDRRAGDIECCTKRGVDGVYGSRNVNRAAARSGKSVSAGGVNVQPTIREVDGGAGVTGERNGIVGARVYGLGSAAEIDGAAGVACDVDAGTTRRARQIIAERDIARCVALYIDKLAGSSLGKTAANADRHGSTADEQTSTLNAGNRSGAINSETAGDVIQLNAIDAGVGSGRVHAPERSSDRSA